MTRKQKESHKGMYHILHRRQLALTRIEREAGGHVANYAGG